MEPWIQNVSMSEIETGSHFPPGENAMLIQIVDVDMDFPTPKYQFKETHQFKFLDVEEQDHVIDPAVKCSQEQADKLVELLKHALENRMNVIVHCHAGICRSGAVAEIGVMLGFADTGKWRQPNLLVKHKMMKPLGWMYDRNERNDGEPWI